MKWKIILNVLFACALVLAGSTYAHAVNYGSHICLTNHSSSCVDVKDNTYKNAQPLWLYDSSQAKGLGFSETDLYPGVCDGDIDNGCQAPVWTPFADHSWDTLYDGHTAAIFDTSGFSFCIGEFGGNVVLHGNCGPAYPDTEWIKNGNNLINVERTNTLDQQAYLMASSTANGTLLQASGLTGGWEQWTETCCF
jgi:hypothetical protein